MFQEVYSKENITSFTRMEFQEREIFFQYKYYTENINKQNEITL